MAPTAAAAATHARCRSNAGKMFPLPLPGAALPQSVKRMNSSNRSDCASTHSVGSATAPAKNYMTLYWAPNQLQVPPSDYIPSADDRRYTANGYNDNTSETGCVSSLSLLTDEPASVRMTLTNHLHSPSVAGRKPAYVGVSDTAARRETYCDKNAGERFISKATDTRHTRPRSSHRSGRNCKGGYRNHHTVCMTDGDDEYEYVDTNEDDDFSGSNHQYATQESWNLLADTSLGFSSSVKKGQRGSWKASQAEADEEFFPYVPPCGLPPSSMFEQQQRQPQTSQHRIDDMFATTATTTTATIHDDVAQSSGSRRDKHKSQSNGCFLSNNIGAGRYTSPALKRQASPPPYLPLPPQQLGAVAASASGKRSPCVLQSGTDSNSVEEIYEKLKTYNEKAGARIQSLEATVFIGHRYVLQEVRNTRERLKEEIQSAVRTAVESLKQDQRQLIEEIITERLNEEVLARRIVNLIAPMLQQTLKQCCCSSRPQQQQLLPKGRQLIDSLAYSDLSALDSIKYYGKSVVKQNLSVPLTPDWLQAAATSSNEDSEGGGQILQTKTPRPNSGGHGGGGGEGGGGGGGADKVYARSHTS